MSGQPSTDLPRRTILLGDVTQRLRDLPASSVDCVITSPPYFRLRDYGADGQLGLESHVEQWVAELRAVAGAIGRVLVPTGTFWLNLGDSYSTHAREGAARKSLLLGPERLALALIEDGWIIRNKIVWAKTNAVPSSVRDRLSASHEVIYLLSRSPQYYFDLDAVRVPHRSAPRRPRPRREIAGRAPAGHPGQHNRPPWLGPNADGYAGLSSLRDAGQPGHPLGKNPGDVWPLSVSQYRGAHFATYPEHLVERMLKAGCPERRCVRCRLPHTRVTKRLGATAVRGALRPGCACAEATEPGLVLDPFLGSGTTAVVAERLDRDWLGIELNPDYLPLAWQRIRTARQAASGAGGSS